MMNIEFKDMPETYEEGNLIFFKEPYKVNSVNWILSHKGCKAVIIDFDVKSPDVNIVAYPKSKEYNIDLYSFIEKSNENNRYTILNNVFSGSLLEV